MEGSRICFQFNLPLRTIVLGCSYVHKLRHQYIMSCEKGGGSYNGNYHEPGRPGSDDILT